MLTLQRNLNGKIGKVNQIGAGWPFWLNLMINDEKNTHITTTCQIEFHNMKLSFKL